MRECVRLLYFAQDAEWQLRISQVDWLISAMSKNILPTLSTSQIDALSWCMSGADSFDEATSKYSLLLRTPFGLHRARWQILQSKIKSLNGSSLVPLRRWFVPEGASLLAAPHPSSCHRIPPWTQIRARRHARPTLAAGP